jgi:hypothetical protein
MDLGDREARPGRGLLGGLLGLAERGRRRLEPLRGKAHDLAAELRRADRSRGDKVVLLAQRLLWSARLSDQVKIGRIVFFELRTPPRVFRGLRDLLVRQANRGDIAAICAVDGAPEDLVRQRLDRGDLCFVGQLEGRVLCHTWFHGGPQPFEEDRQLYADWAIPEGTYWSYDAAANAESRASGVFVKVFQTALGTLFREHGAQRVQCYVRLANESSLVLHERLGFRRVGVMTGVALPWVRWLRFDAPPVSQQWLVPYRGELRLPVPAVPPPASLGLA